MTTLLNPSHYIATVLTCFYKQLDYYLELSDKLREGELNSASMTYTYEEVRVTLDLSYIADKPTRRKAASDIAVNVTFEPSTFKGDIGIKRGEEEEVVFNTLFNTDKIRSLVLGITKLDHTDLYIESIVYDGIVITDDVKEYVSAGNYEAVTFK